MTHAVMAARRGDAQVATDAAKSASGTKVINTVLAA
jgi:hypothetical protein